MPETQARASWMPFSFDALLWKVISYGHRKKFCAIAPHSRWVNLQFHAGASLTDRADILTGTGKSMRHVKVASGDDLGADLADLIQQAAEQAR